MRWKISSFIFCDQQQTLTSEAETQQLEPMVVELLSYFCQNTGKIISKDQLIEQVWLGRIVSDNAISRVITKLRKVLSDDVRKPQFIATFPKKGYKFIALVELLAEDVSSQIVTIKDEPRETNALVHSLNNVDDVLKVTTSIEKPLLLKPKIFIWLALSFTIIILVLFSNGLTWFQKDDSTKQPLLTHAKALTRDAGNEFSPSMSPDGSRVAYMSVQNNQMRLLVKNISDERTVEVGHKIENGSDVGVGPASWSTDGKLLVYLVATPDLCQYYLRTINGLTLGEPQLIHNCPAGSYGQILFTHDNNRVVFSQTSGGNTPYSLFEMNLTTESKVRLSQPALYLGGNSQFDLHPTENKLLISSPDEQQWEGFYALDLDSDNLTLLFKQDAYICCGIWSHDGERVVLMGEYPAYQLLSYDLTGNDMQIIYSGAQKLNRPIRHSNGSDYLFSSDLYNIDLNLIPLGSDESIVIANSSVDDRLSKFAHQSEKIAYISLSSGHEEIWITDTSAGQRRKLTSFNDSRHYIDLQWSPNDRLLMALTINEIHIIDAQMGTFKRLKIPQSEIRAVSFKDNNSVAYSMKVGRQWRVHHYHLSNETVNILKTPWQYVQYTAARDNTLWIDQEDAIYWGKEQKLINDKVLLKQNVLHGRVFNLKKQHQQWFWFDYEGGEALIVYSPLSGKLESFKQTGVADFDIKENQVLYGELKRINTDIYQTQSLDN